MLEPIYLVGAGQTRFGEWWDKSLEDLMQEAIDEAIEDADITSLDIDMVITGNMIGQLGSNQAHLGAIVSSKLPHHPPALRVEAACASGGVAIHTACGLIESGKADTILVIGAEKMTDIPTDEVASALMGAADAEKDLRCGLTFPGIFGLVAAKYMDEFGLTREQLSLVSSTHHSNAQDNPFAQFRSKITPEAVTNSSMIADPLTLLDCSPITDGAAAIILSRSKKSPHVITASQLSTDTLSLADRPNCVSFGATREAMNLALQESEISQSDIDHVELHDCFSIAALISLEDMGFADAGEAISLYKHPSNQTTFNRSGGLKACGHPVAATGVKQMIDIRKQLLASESTYGLTHNFGGVGATCAIHILKQDLTC